MNLPDHSWSCHPSLRLAATLSSHAQEEAQVHLFGSVIRVIKDELVLPRTSSGRLNKAESRTMKRILVINDEQEILELLHDLLCEEGYEVFMYSYAIEELAEIKRFNPDLIILDLMLGDHQPKGWQTLQKLKLDQATASIPVIVCTAAERSVKEQEGFLLSKGVLVVLKPFDIEDLVEAVRKAFSLIAPSLEVLE